MDRLRDGDGKTRDTHHPFDRESVESRHHLMLPRDKAAGKPPPFARAYESSSDHVAAALLPELAVTSRTTTGHDKAPTH